MCIKSWQEILSSYRIKEWNEDNFDMHCSPWIEKAYLDKKWAFVADYVRFKVLYEEGGLYFDTDILLKTDISNFLKHRFFTQWEFPLDWQYLKEYHITDTDGTFHGDKENPKHMAMCGMLTALMGAERNHPLIKRCLDYYDNTDYTGVSSSYSNQSIVCDDILLAKLWKYGLKMKDEKQCLEEGIVIYPSTTSAGSISHIHTDNYAIHLCSSTWRDGKKQEISRWIKTAVCMFYRIPCFHKLFKL